MNKEDVQELVDCYLKSIALSKVMKEPDPLSILKVLYIFISKYKSVLVTKQFYTI